MYVDDTHITYAGSDLHLIQSSLSHDLEKLSKWLVSNRLTLNATKTEFMLIGSRQRLSTLSDTLELSTDNVSIEQVLIHLTTLKSYANGLCLTDLP